VGPGAIYARVAAALGDTVRFEQEVVGVDARRRLLRFADGSSEGYDQLVSTMPLDRLVAALEECPSEMRVAASALEHTSVWMVGVGYEQPLADDRSWLYFPQESVPFYRVTNFAKYAAANVPAGDTARYSSFLTETASSRYRPLRRSAVERGVPHALTAVGLAHAEASVASVHVEEVPYAYPVPTLERDAALQVIQPWLMTNGIQSRGRFGAWRYEIGNMDHAVKMGTDVARRLVLGLEEELWAP
jgi:protoporphyrinogen oxidase